MAVSGAALAIVIESVRPLNPSIADRAMLFPGLLVIGLVALLTTQLADYMLAKARVATHLMERPPFAPLLVPTFLKWTTVLVVALLAGLVVIVIEHRREAALASWLAGHVIASAIIAATLVEAWAGYLIGERLREIVRRWPETVDDPRQIELSLRRPGGAVLFLASLSAVSLIGAQLPWPRVATVAQTMLGLSFGGLMLRCMYMSSEGLLSRAIALVVVAWAVLEMALGSLGLYRLSLVIDVIMFSGFAMAMCRAILRIKR
jgi:hypothetical protein